ncbi:hypothetical protein CL654_00750 [bacterium]|nr:hypothetical protein [bacterium]|tara:strand:- start:12278 stop:13735 length:1458 start_codon:yes stop_codon:yes gene_type:complete
MFLQAHKKEKGFALAGVLVFGFIGALLVAGIVSWAGTNIKSARRDVLREQALQVAEAGIEYYRWHLAHDKTDYQDGTGGPGPYVHDFLDKEGTKIGEFSLDITPPATGTTIVIIESTGTILEDPNVERTIEATLAIPSIARFSVVANDVIRFGEGTETFGPIHSNEGIRFDGLAHNIVSSAVAEYNDPDHGGQFGPMEFGVHTHVTPVDPEPPASVPLRPDVFEAGRTFPVPAVDFDGFTNDLSNLKTEAQSDGLYFADSSALGYNIVLKTDDTLDLYRVDTTFPPPSNGCNNPGQNDWGVWSVGTQTLLGNYPFPSNGIVFVEDDLWVEGQIDSARISLAAARFPENPGNYANISFTNDILYTNYDGTDVIGLFSQNDINAGLTSADILRIDAALIAQNGRVGRYYYRPQQGGNPRCTPYDDRDTITLYGMIATSERYGFAYTDGNGYDTRNIIYDANLLYGPPPLFPLSTDQYETISWREVVN